MPTTISGSSGVTFPDATTQTTAATASIPAGAITNFVNASAPTGWTKLTTNDNAAIRIVSGTGGGTGGSVGFTTAFASQTTTGTVGGYTLATADIPSHSHPVPYGTGSATTIANAIAYAWGGQIASANTYTNEISTYTGSGRNIISVTGGGGSHTHSFTPGTINLAVKYVDCIMCSKN